MLRLFFNIKDYKTGLKTFRRETFTKKSAKSGIIQSSSWSDYTKSARKVI